MVILMLIIKEMKQVLSRCHLKIPCIILMHQYLLTCWTLWSTVHNKFYVSFVWVRACVHQLWTPALNEMEIIDLKFSAFDLFGVGLGPFWICQPYKWCYTITTQYCLTFKMDALIVCVRACVCCWTVLLSVLKVLLRFELTINTDTAGIKWPNTTNCTTIKNVQIVTAKLSNECVYVCLTHLFSLTQIWLLTCAKNGNKNVLCHAELCRSVLFYWIRE